MLKDPNSILSDLAQLSDPQLESVKQIYKNDPFIPSAANSELVRRASFKKRFGGIAQLPAQNMQTLAGGGIVAFAGGGDTEDGTVYYDPSMDIRQGYEDQILVGDEAADRAALLNTLRKLKAAGKDVLSMPVRGIAGAAESVITRPLRAMGVPVPYLSESFYGGDRSSPTPYMDALLREEGRPRTAADFQRGDKDVTSVPAPTPVEQAAAAARMAAGAAPGAAEAPGSTSVSATMRGAAGAPGAGAFSYPVSKALEDAAALQKGVPEALAPLFKAERERREAQNKATEEYYAQNQPKGKAYESYEKALLEERGKAAGLREEAKNDAIVRAGLAMMAGESRNAFANIGKGAMAGVEAFGAAKKELAAQDKERTKALAMIEQARRLEERGDFEAAAKRRAEGLGRLDAVHNAELTTQAGLITETPKVAGQLRAAGLKIEGDILQESMRNAAYMAVARMRDSAGAGGTSGARLQQEAIRQSVTLTKEILETNPALAKNPDAVNALRQGIYMNIMQQLGQPGGAAPSAGAPSKGWTKAEQIKP